MHDPAAAKGRLRAMIRTAFPISLLPRSLSPITPDRHSDSRVKPQDSRKENPRQYLISPEKFSRPAPLASETKRLVDSRIFPFASTIIKLKTEKVRDISPTAAVPVRVDTAALKTIPAVCMARLSSVIFTASAAIFFSDIFRMSIAFSFHCSGCFTVIIFTWVSDYTFYFLHILMGILLQEVINYV